MRIWIRFLIKKNWRIEDQIDKIQMRDSLPIQSYNGSVGGDLIGGEGEGVGRSKIDYFWLYTSKNGKTLAIWVNILIKMGHNAYF